MRTRKIIAAVMAAALTLTSLPAFTSADAAETKSTAAAESSRSIEFEGRTYTFTEEKGIRYILCDGMKFAALGHEATLVSADGIKGKIIIPKTIPLPSYTADNAAATAEVTEIGDHSFSRSFYDTDDITSVTIPESVNRIGEGAFDSRSITEIIAPDKYIELDQYAIYDTGWYEERLESGEETIFCGNLITVPDVEEYVVPEGVKSIYEAGSGLKKLKKLTVPEGVEYIIDSFGGCDNLREVTIPLSVREVDEMSFGYCTNLDGLHIAGAAREWSKTARFMNPSLALFDESGNQFYYPTEKPTESCEPYERILDSVKTELTVGESEEIRVFGRWFTPLIVREDGVYDDHHVLKIEKIGRVNDPGDRTSYTVTYRITAVEPGTCYFQFYMSNFWSEFSERLKFTVTESDGTVSEATTMSAENGRPASGTGDANCDGKVNVSDAVAVLQYIANNEKYPLSATGAANADIDGEKGITGGDAIAIQKIDAGIMTLE